MDRRDVPKLAVPIVSTGVLQATHAEASPAQDRAPARRRQSGDGIHACPSLLIRGDKDVSAPVELTRRPTAEMIPVAELRVYEGHRTICF